MSRNKWLLTLAAILATVVDIGDARAARGPAADLDITSFYLDQGDWYNELYISIGAEAKNLGTTCVEDITCSVELYAGGEFLTTREVLVYVDHLRPGGTTPLYAGFSVIVDDPRTRADNVIWHLSGVPTSEEPYEPTTSLVYVDERRSGEGRTFHLTAEIQNTGAQPIAVKHVVASLYESSGNIHKVRREGPWGDWILEPGGTYPFCCWRDGELYEHVGQTASWRIQVAAQPTTNSPLPLEITNVVESSKWGMPVFAGDVHNPNGVSTGTVYVLVLLRAEDGRLLNHSVEYLQALGPGETKHFQTVGWCNEFDTGWIADYRYSEVQVQCQTTQAAPTPTPTCSPGPTSTPTSTLTPTHTRTPTGTATPTATVQEVRFRGTATEQLGLGCMDCYYGWSVRVEEVLTGPFISGEWAVITGGGLAGCSGGYADESIRPRDQVEVYAQLLREQGIAQVCNGSDDYYITRATWIDRTYLPLIQKGFVLANR